MAMIELLTPVGILTMYSDGEGLTAIRFGKATGAPDPDPLLERAAGYLQEYFAGHRKDFPLPLHLAGTAFQKRVWEEMRKIPYGETRTYGQLAGAAGRPRAARAVGTACRENPLPIIVPCHRVVGAGGKPGGYSGGQGLATKAQLLELEGKSR